MDVNSNNLVINGYSGVWAYDHDDCSQFVLDHDSFMVFGGEWKVLCVLPALSPLPRTTYPPHSSLPPTHISRLQKLSWKLKILQLQCYHVPWHEWSECRGPQVPNR